MASQASWDGLQYLYQAGWISVTVLPRPPVVVTLTFPSHAELIA